MFRLRLKSLRGFVLILILFKVLVVLVVCFRHLYEDDFDIFSVKGVKLLFSDPYYAHYDPSSPPVWHLKDSGKVNFVSVAKGLYCFKEGTHVDVSKSIKTCECDKFYKGSSCGIPVRFSYPEWPPLKPKLRPRRIIHMLSVGSNIDMFDIRLHMLYDVVDLFIVGEYLNPAALKRELNESCLYNSLKSGWLKGFQDKILYVPITNVTDCEDELVDDRSTLLCSLSQRSMKLLSDVRLDDLILYTEWDELPHPQLLQFLTSFGGYAVPIVLRYRWSANGFVRSVAPSRNSTEGSILVTVGVLRDVYNYNLAKLKVDHTSSDSLWKYKDSKPVAATADVISNAGWKCVSCMSAVREEDCVQLMPNETTKIVRKEKNLTVVDLAFNDTKHYMKSLLEDIDPESVPPYVAAHPSKFWHLLRN